ncbi:hypothetical protein FHETE_2235 [Fusarium heterosporum]|uniref:Uncharacterized protein n=1 Tax=Fusarium heterosporum TaxID=42747 RepID=A0A8H5TV82_FUSHE|nr:hypothetical protein FHETE_2235 [Fusarium heterosporum]
MKLFLTIFVLLKLATAAQAARWTLHRSCYENNAYKEGLIKAMEIAKSRSAFCASKLREIDAMNHRNPLYGAPDTALPICATEADVLLQERYEMFGELEGPIGKDSGFADSDEWRGRNNPFQTDFVLYCAPDLSEREVPLNGMQPWDNARQRILAPDNALILIQRDIDAGTWADPEKKAEAVTFRAPPTLITGEEAARIPNTITFNPIWLNHRMQEGGLFASDESLEKMTKKGALAELKKSWKPNARATPVDTMIEDLSVTLLHEMFHTHAFGGYSDLPNNDVAYNWMNNIEHKEKDNPELIAIIALIFDLKQNKKVTVNKDGEMKK